MIFLILICGRLIAQSIDPKVIYNKIQDLNRENRFEESIIKLENIINSDNSSPYDKYHAYLLKAQTYKRVFDYLSTSKNLDLAYQEGMKTDHKQEVETRIKIEKMFVEFDQQKYDNVRDIISDINPDGLKLVDGTTLAFYYNMLAAAEMQEGNYKKAEDILNQGIGLLDKNEPQHLPAVYIKLIELAEFTNDEKAALDAFRKGLYFSDEYKMGIYKVNLYKQLSHFYVGRKDYKNAYNLFIIGSNLIGSYDAPSRSGKLNSVEKELMMARKDLELRNDRNKLIFVSVLLIILFILICVLFQLFRVNRKSRKLVEQENDRIRAELEKLTDELAKNNYSEKDLSRYNLTERQLEIIELIKAGKSNKEIAAELFISENTVKYHLKIIYSLLGIDNRVRLK
ncbi:MAG: LuxR C-terminal-related transcriptional regulator [Moheibacter sp.]